MSQSSALQAIACPPPSLTAASACEIARRYYGLKVTATPLVSERDQNFRLAADDGSRWVLKIANASEDPQVTDFQIQALHHIANQPPPGVAVPVLRLTDSGADRVRLSHGGSTLTGRLVSYLPGRPPDPAQLTGPLAHNAGVSLARLAASLAGFEHPGSRQALLWDMQQACLLGDLLPCISDPDDRKLIAACLDDFAARALPRFPALRAQVIHNDLNPANMLVSDERPDRIAGVIDFGDMQHAPLVVDLGVAASYLRSLQDDPLALVTEFVAGYHSVTPLLPDEIELLYDLTNTRLATTIVILAWRRDERDADDDYLGAAARQEGSAALFLKRMRDLSRADVTRRLHEVCDTQPSRQPVL